MTHNNESMQTEVQTFFIKETEELVLDDSKLSEWHEKIEALGLAGQKNVVIEKKSPIPFLWMNQALVNTIETLCPTKVELKEYDKTPIPLEALSMVSLSMKEGYFDHIEVWYNEKEKDPAIIGYKFTPEYAHKEMWLKIHYANKYLVARWGDVRESLDALVDRAKKVFIAAEKQNCENQIKHYQRALEDVESAAAGRFGNAMPETINLPF